MSEDLPESMPQDMPERMSDDLPDKWGSLEMSEDSGDGERSKQLSEFFFCGHVWKTRCSQFLLDTVFSILSPRRDAGLFRRRQLA